MVVASDPRLPEIEKELSQVWTRTVARTFKRHGKYGPLAIPKLREFTKQLQAELWKRDKTQALEEVIRAAILKLPHELMGHSRTMHVDEAACYLYNIDVPLLGVERLNLSDAVPHGIRWSNYLHNLVIQQAGIHASESTITNIFSDIRQHIAKNLLDLADAATARDDESPHAPGDAVPYIQRPKEQIKIAEWLASNDRLALVFGDSGTGKSATTAHALAAHQRAYGIQVITLDAATSYRFFDTLSQHLNNRSQSDIGRLKFEFILSLRRAPRSTILFIDNVSKWELIEDFTQAAPRCILTSESKVVPAGIPHRQVELEGLRYGECEKLIQHFRPDATDMQLFELSTAVAGRPQLLIDSLTMADTDHMTIEDICDCFGSDTSDIARIIGKGSRAVDKQYRRYYSALKERNPAAALFLAVVIHLDQPEIPLELVRRVWSRAAEAAALRVERPDSEAKLMAIAIEERSVLKVVDEQVRSHALTRRVFRSLELGYRDAIYSALFSNYGDSLKMFENVLHRDSLVWVPPVSAALLRLSATDLLAVVDSPRKLTAVVMTAYHGLRQLGDFISARYVLQWFLSDEKLVDAGAVYGQMILDYYCSEFELGSIGRLEFSALLESMVKNGLFSSESMTYQLRWLALRVRYNHDQAFSESQQSILPVLAHGSEEEKRREALTETMYDNVQSLEFIGHVETALQMCYAYVADRELPIPRVRRLRAASDGCRMSALTSSTELAEYFVNGARTLHREISEDTEIAEADALLTLAEAWYNRRTAPKVAESLTANISKFMEAGHLLVGSGQYRRGMEAYAEAIALMYCGRLFSLKEIKVPGFDFSPEEFLSYVFRFAEDAEEWHTLLRLWVVANFSRALSESSDMIGLCALEETAWKAAFLCEDARTYRQATLGATAIRSYMHLRSRKGMRDSLFQVMKRGQPRLTRKQYEEFATVIVTRGPGYTLVL